MKRNTAWAPFSIVFLMTFHFCVSKVSTPSVFVGLKMAARSGSRMRPTLIFSAILIAPSVCVWTDFPGNWKPP